MIELKTEKDIREHFSGVALQFQIFYDGIVEYTTVMPTNIEGEYYSFKICLFPEDNPFFTFDEVNGLLGVMQIFEVSALDSKGKETHTLYSNKYEENQLIKNK